MDGHCAFLNSYNTSENDFWELDWPSLRSYALHVRFKVLGFAKNLAANAVAQ